VFDVLKVSVESEEEAPPSPPPISVQVGGMLLSHI